MLLKEWTNIGSFDFFTNKLRILATNDLHPEKWSSTGRNDFNILSSYIRYTFEKLWDESEQAEESSQQTYIY